MPKKCVNKKPSIRLTVHSPANPVHPHVDTVTHATGDTDWEAWSHAMHQCLIALGYTDDRLILGFYLDLINRLPGELRMAMLKGIAEGYGLQVTSEVDEETKEPTVTAGLVPRSTSLTGDVEKTPSGLALPNSAGSDLVDTSGNPIK